mmetsp:Transcript_93939/g.235831  ORF Transcript_93939/g.235831 Transcript_93939/m.235831 type:complete len:259 (+) Transcript_93939:2090-2866(+)
MQSTFSVKHILVSSRGELLPSSPQATPPIEGTFSISRLRYCCELSEQALQESQAPSKQSVDGHAWVLQDSPSTSGLWHGSPPPVARAPIRLVLSCQPPPQDAEHADQASHSSKTHGELGNAMWDCALTSRSAPLQGTPPLEGNCTTERVRYMSPSESVASALFHSCHGENSQSCLTVQPSWLVHFFVSTNVPEQASPHSLFISSITRLRSHKPMQVGCCHSVHSPNLQSRGTQPGEHGWMGKHCSKSICVPAQDAPPS